MLSIIVTVLFNASHGSILLSALFHFQVMNPIFPDAQPYDTYLLIVVAVLVVWLNRKAMYTKEGSVTEVIPRAESQVRQYNPGTGAGTLSYELEK